MALDTRHRTPFFEEDLAVKIPSLLCGLLLASVCLTAYPDSALKPFKITFQTTDCNGQTGMASVDVDRVDRIQTIDCPTPSGRTLKQVLVRSGPGLTSYDAFTVTNDESSRIQRQIDSYMHARQKALEEGKSLIIEH